MRMVPPPLDLEPPLDLVVVDLVDDLGVLYVERERVVLVDLVVGVVVLVLLVLLGELVLDSRVVVIVPSLFLTDRVFVVVLVWHLVLFEQQPKDENSALSVGENSHERSDHQQAWHH